MQLVTRHWPATGLARLRYIQCTSQQSKEIMGSFTSHFRSCYAPSFNRMLADHRICGPLASRSSRPVARRTSTSEISLSTIRNSVTGPPKSPGRREAALPARYRLANKSLCRLLLASKRSKQQTRRSTYVSHMVG